MRTRQLLTLKEGSSCFLMKKEKTNGKEQNRTQKNWYQ